MMEIIGEVQYRNGQVELSSLLEIEEGTSFSVLKVGGQVWLVSHLSHPERAAQIEQLTIQAINDHRKTLEGLAR